MTPQPSPICSSGKKSRVFGYRGRLRTSPPAMQSERYDFILISPDSAGRIRMHAQSGVCCRRCFGGRIEVSLLCRDLCLHEVAACQRQPVTFPQIRHIDRKFPERAPNGPRVILPAAGALSHDEPHDTRAFATKHRGSAILNAPATQTLEFVWCQGSQLRSETLTSHTLL